MNVRRNKRLQEQVEKLRNKRKEEDAKDELKRLIILGSLNPERTSKLPRTNKINFEVKTIIDTQGYNNIYDYHRPLLPSRSKRHDFKKNAESLLDISVIADKHLYQLQDERLDKIQEIEASMRVNDYDKYINSASKLNSLKYDDNNPYSDFGQTKSKFIGATSEFVKNGSDRFAHSFDSRRKSGLVNLDLNPRVVRGSRHQNDPFIAGL